MLVCQMSWKVCNKNRKHLMTMKRTKRLKATTVLPSTTIRTYMSKCVCVHENAPTANNVYCLCVRLCAWKCLFISLQLQIMTSWYICCTVFYCFCCTYWNIHVGIETAVAGWCADILKKWGNLHYQPARGRWTVVARWHGGKRGQ